MANVDIIPANRTTAQIAAATTTVPLDGQIVYNTDNGQYCIGDGVTALSALTFYGGVSSSGLTIGTSTITSGTNTRVLYNNNGVVGEYAVTGTGTTAVLSTSPTFTNYILVNGNNAGMLNSQYKNTNTVGYYTLNVSSDTGSSLAELSVFNSAGAVGGLYANETPVLSLYKSAGYGLIVNEATNGALKFVVGGFTSTQEKIDISTTVTTFKGNTLNIDSGTASRIMATDASKNVQFLDTATYPSLTELAYVKGVTSAIQTQLDNKLIAIMCQGATGTVQFTASSTTYWSVMVVPASSLRSTVGQSLTSLPYNCTLVGAQITTWNASSSVSQTNSTLYFRLNGVDNTISSSVLWSASAATANVINVTNLNVAVTAGTTWELKLVMGALATAPTNAAQCNVILYFRI